MNKKLLFKISLSVSLIGIMILLILSNTIKPTLMNISEINNNHINKNVKIQGKIINLKDFKDYNFQLITVQDSTAKIGIVLQYSKEPTRLNKNQELLIIGKVQPYKDYLQIQVSEIRISKPN